jgi:hypothetical protein
MKVREEKLIQFKTGAKRSVRTGKGRYDLISPIALRRLSKVYEQGAEQKGDRNWEKGFEMSRSIDSALRHINQYREGFRDEDHIAQACWNLFACIHFEEQIEKGRLSKNFNDLPKYI